MRMWGVLTLCVERRGAREAREAAIIQRQVGDSVQLGLAWNLDSARHGLPAAERDTQVRAR